MTPSWTVLLVRRSVLLKAENPTINMGPKTATRSRQPAYWLIANLHGWKDDAWPNDKLVLPNHICTMSQAIALTDHLFESEARVQSVNNKPEKQMDAMNIKNPNSTAIARSALAIWTSSAREDRRKKNAKDVHDDDVIGDQEECKSGWWLKIQMRTRRECLSNLGKRMQAPQARISKPKSEADAITVHDKLNWQSWV
jgi:hypothetical protein